MAIGKSFISEEIGVLGGIHMLLMLVITMLEGCQDPDLLIARIRLLEDGQGLVMPMNPALEDGQALYTGLLMTMKGALEHDKGLLLPTDIVPKHGQSLHFRTDQSPRAWPRAAGASGSRRKEWPKSTHANGSSPRAQPRSARGNHGDPNPKDVDDRDNNDDDLFIGNFLGDALWRFSRFLFSFVHLFSTSPRPHNLTHTCNIWNHLMQKVSLVLGESLGKRLFARSAELPRKTLYKGSTAERRVTSWRWRKETWTGTVRTIYCGWRAWKKRSLSFFKLTLLITQGKGPKVCSMCRRLWHKNLITSGGSQAKILSS